MNGEPTTQPDDDRATSQARVTTGLRGRSCSLRRAVAASIAVCSLTVGALVAGCTGEAAPTGTPSGGSTGATTSAAPTPPPRPTDQPTPESAIQFVRYFWQLYNYAYATYDTAPLAAISDPQCKFCTSAVSDLKAIVSSQAKATGYSVTPLEIVSPPTKITTGTIVISTIKQDSGELKLKSGEVKESRGWKTLRTNFSLSWSGSTWAVEGVDADTETGVR